MSRTSKPNSSVSRQSPLPDRGAGSGPKPREVEALLLALGFVVVRQRGSHRQYRHADGRCTTLPFHAGRDISPILMRQIARDIGVTIDALLAAKQ